MSNENGPELVAYFQTDSEGRPAFRSTSTGQRSYPIIIEVKREPSDAYSAIFELHPSYYDPLRTVLRDKDGAFRLKTTAHRDFPLTVRFLKRSGQTFVTDTLYHALERAQSKGHRQRALDEALAYFSRTPSPH